MPDRITPAIQDYLKAIHGLGGAENVVSPADIATRLEVKGPSVTGMLSRFRGRGPDRIRNRPRRQLDRGGHRPSTARDPSASTARIIPHASLRPRLERSRRRSRRAGTRHFSPSGGSTRGASGRTSRGPARPPHPQLNAPSKNAISSNSTSFDSRASVSSFAKCKWQDDNPASVCAAGRLWAYYPGLPSCS